MKIILLPLLFLVCNSYIHAQYSPDRSAPYGWDSWTTVYSDAAGSISISFEIAPKHNVCNGMGYSYYRIQSTFVEKVKADIYFSYVDCDGKIMQEHTFEDFNQGPTLDHALGLWFLGYIGNSITNIHASNLKFPDREAKAIAIKRQQDSLADAQKQKLEQQRAQEDQQKLQQSKTQQQNQQQQLAKQRELQISQDQLKAKLDEYHANVNNNFDQLSGAIQDLGNAILAQQELEARRAEQKRFEEENLYQQQKIDRELRKLKEQEEIDKQNYIKEQNRIAEQEIIMKWEAKASDIFTPDIQKYKKATFPLEITDSKLNSVYYVIWSFSSNNELIIIPPYEVKKSPDGDWILTDDFKSQLAAKTKLNLNTTPDGTPIVNNDLHYLIGYIENYNDALNVFTQIKQNAKNKGMVVVELSNISNNEPSKEKSKSFWEE